MHCISLKLVVQNFLNVIDTEVIPPSFLLAFMKSDRSEEQAKEDLRNTVQGGVKAMLEERVRVSKELGVDNVYPLVRSGKTVEQIITAAEEESCDLVVMASSKLLPQYVH
jgi:nucleotide-binding universal stress UspA family protein